MKYQCGHVGCDICGASQCMARGCRRDIRLIGNYEVCEMCMQVAVGFSYRAACTFGGTVIDPSRTCEKRDENNSSHDVDFA